MVKFLQKIRANLRVFCIAILIVTCYVSTFICQTIYNVVACGLALIGSVATQKRWRWSIRRAQIRIVRFYSQAFCVVMNIRLSIYQCIESPTSTQNPVLRYRLQPSSQAEIDAVSVLPYALSTTHKIMYQSNHVSFVDVLLIGSIFRTSFLSKNDVLSWPVLGRMIHWAGIQFLRRESTYDRYRCLFTLKKNLCYVPYCVFPEGTTTQHALPNFDKWNSANMWVLQKSKEFGVMALSVCYENTKDNAWIGDTSFLDLLYRVAYRPSTSAKIVWSYVPGHTLSHLSLREQSLKIFSLIHAQCIEAHVQYTSSCA